MGVGTEASEPLVEAKAGEEAEKEAEAEVKIEQVEAQPEIDVDEKRRLDSIRQVKEHGHAH